MNDDIVTRLREQMQGCDNRNCEGCEVEAEAADEIELLRKDVEFWEKRYWQLVAEVTP